MTTIGSFCTGYGGLDLAVEAAYDARTIWTSDIDPGACKVIAHRFPDAPNIGDMTTVDWSQLERPNIITGGTPCQDLSHAGRRKGMTEGTRSNLWVTMREAVAHLQPDLVVWENVRGAYSAEADSEMGPCPGCLDDPRQRGPVLRALGRVLGDLSDLGYDSRWVGLRAADVGACHGRFRVFVVAANTNSVGHQRPRLARHGRTGLADGNRGAVALLLPTPTTRDHKGQNQRGDDSCLTGALLPTPRATDGTNGGPNQRGSSGDLMLPSAVHLLPTSTETMKLLPTPDASVSQDGEGFATWEARRLIALAKKYNGNGIGMPLTIAVQPEAGMWAQYTAAVTRWEVVTRPAPGPTETGPKGGRRLSPRFSEWMMGVPAGWITDTPGVTRNEALKLAGNGVVPQQAYEAIMRAERMEVAA